MLPKRFRLKKQDIERLLKRGKVYYNRNFTLRFLENRNRAWRFAIIIPRKIAPKATQRNFLRRKAYAFLGDFAKKPPLKTHDVALWWRKIPEEKIDEALLETFKKCALLP